MNTTAQTLIGTITPEQVTPTELAGLRNLARTLTSGALHTFIGHLHDELAAGRAVIITAAPAPNPKPAPSPDEFILEGSAEHRAMLNWIELGERIAKMARTLKDLSKEATESAEEARLRARHFAAVAAHNDWSAINTSSRHHGIVEFREHVDMKVSTTDGPARETWVSVADYLRAH